MATEFIAKELSVEKVKALVDKQYMYDLFKKETETGVKAGDENKYLVGAYDLHCHAGPDYQKRASDMIDEAVEASKFGMAGITFKEHYFLTGSCAYLVERYLDLAIAHGELKHKPKVYGGVGLCLGLNPDAVRLAARVSNVKVIWFPTFNVKGAGKVSWLAHQQELPLTRNGKALPEVEEIIDIAAENNLFISGGHSSFEELLPMVEAASRKKVPVLLDHPLARGNRIQMPELHQLTQAGAYVGLYSMTFLPSIYLPVCDPMDTVRAIHELGPEHCCLASDVGQLLHGTGVEAYRSMIRTLLVLGITGEQIRTMTRDVPMKILKETP